MLLPSYSVNLKGPLRKLQNFPMLKDLQGFNTLRQRVRKGSDAFSSHSSVTKGVTYS